MKALVFNIRLNSLYSIRIPFTWQSALTYPVLPPSAIIGMLANALQRYKNDRHPLQCLEKIENELIWTGSKLLSPCIIKSYITSAIVKWEDVTPWKFTNALGKQFAYAQQIQIATIFRDESIINEIIEALKTSPLTCGDSESPITIEDEVFIKNIYEIDEETITTGYPVPFSKDTKIKDGNGRLYLMHERCKKKDTSLYLRTYLIPIVERQGIYYPSTIRIERTNEKFFKIDEIDFLVAEDSSPESMLQKKKPNKKRKK